MIPLRDNVPRKTLPFTTLGLVGANAWVFLKELAMGRRLDRFILRWGLVPKRYAVPGAWAKLGAKAYFGPFLSSMFLHGGWLHILSNMWVLVIFGDNVEDRLGHLRFLWFYLACGLAAGLAQIWASWGSPIPTIGASGAIAGVMGAFFVLYPRARIVTLIPIFIFFETIELPAFLFLGLWLWMQIYSGSHAFGGAGGVAWWAHVGGFSAGLVLHPLFLRPRRVIRRWQPDEYGVEGAWM